MWAFQPMANACLQILSLIGLGYFMTWRRVFTSEKYLPQVNTFLMYISFTSLNLSAVGITLDLRNEDAWRALAAYILWIAFIQVDVTVYVMVFARRDPGEAGLLNLLLTANNTVITGLPILDATFGSAGRYISLLTGVAVFLQVMPYSIVAFELERWVVRQATRSLSSSDGELDPISACQLAGQLPRPDGTGKFSQVGAAGKQDSDARASSTTASSRAALAGTASSSDAHLGSDGEKGEKQHAGCKGMPAGVGGQSEAMEVTPLGGSFASMDGEGLTSPTPGLDEGSDSAVPPGVRPVVSVADLLLPLPPEPFLGSHDGDEPHGRGDAHPHTHGHQLSASRPTSPPPLPRVSPLHVHTGHGHAVAVAHVAGITHPAHLALPVPPSHRHHLSVRTHPGLPPRPPTPLSITPPEPGASGAPSPQQHGAQSPSHSHPAQHALHPPHAVHHHHQHHHHNHHHNNQSHAAGGDRSGARTPRTPGAFARQLHDYLHLAAELRHRRKVRKRRQREAVSVVDAPVPFAPGLQLGREVIQALGEAEDDAASDEALRRKMAAIAAGQGGGHHHAQGPPQGHSWHERSLDALHRLINRSSEALAHFAQFAVTPRGSLAAGHAGHPWWDRAHAPEPDPLAPPQPQLGAERPPSPATHGGRQLPGEHDEAEGEHRALTGALQDSDPGCQWCGWQDCNWCRAGGGEGWWDGCGGGAGCGACTRDEDVARQLRQRSLTRTVTVQAAMQTVATQHGGFIGALLEFVRTHAQWWHVAFVICKNPMLWSLLLALVISLSGLNQFLNPSDPSYVVELGWIYSTLKALTGTVVPLALFSNGVFLNGKRFWEGNVQKAAVIIGLKLTVLPALQLACAKMLNLTTAQGMSLVLLSVCPTATTAFVIATQYQHGAELVTMCTVLLTVLLVPVMLAALNLPRLLGLYSFNPAEFPLP